MKTWSKSKIAFIASLGILISFSLWVRDQYQYKVLDYYRCDGRKEVVIPQQRFILQDVIELYVGGWIERGEVTISGLPSHENEDLKFPRDSSVHTVSHAYASEWYGRDIRIVFDPVEDSSCYIKVVYKYG